MDAIAEWTAAQTRVIDLVADLPAAASERRVPATPDWTVRDLLSHMIGLDADVLAGDEPDDHNPRWTQHQVDARADRDVSALVDEWRALTAPMRDWMASNTTRPLGDVVIHEQDLRGALDRPGARDTAALATLRDRFVTRITDKISDAGLPPIRFAGDTWTSGPDDAAVVLRASDWDLTRLILSRRSAAQARSYVERGDLDPYLATFGALGPLREDDLVE